MKLPDWLSNPILGLVGLLASIAGLIFGVYTYQTSKQIRELIYAIEPERSVLIDSRKASDFEVRYKGNIIKTDVSSAIVTVWNAGNESIRSNNVLKPVTINIGNGVSVLEAKVLRSSRDLTGFNLDTSRSKDGIIVPQWDILEKDDGAVIQVSYAGLREVPISMSGVIEGRRAIKEFPLKTSPLHALIMRSIMGLSAALLILLKIYEHIKLRNIKVNKFEIITWLNIVVMIAFAIYYPKLTQVNIPVKF